MATKKKQTADEPTSKKAPAPATKKAPAPAAAPAPEPSATSAKPSVKVEVDWGKGFIEHNNAVVTGDSIKVPIPFNARRASGGSQTKNRYAHVRVKLNAEEVRVSERRFHKAPSETDPSLTFQIAKDAAVAK